MWTVRAVRIGDLDRLESLIRSATRGLTTLQLKHDQILDRIEQSVFAFTRTGQSIKDEPYVLVLADDETGELVGTSTIYAKTGGFQPFYSYRVVTREHHSEMLGVSHRRTSLELKRVHDGLTEIGSLFLRGTHRNQGRGRWLSLARFTLMAARRSRFSNRVIAEMRGKAEADGRVPFWESVTGRFIPVEFAVADAMSTVAKDFIEDMMPEHPIYLDLLPVDVREKIAAVHDETKPALALLQSQGFSSTDEVDIFDAGPVLNCDTDSIRAVQSTLRRAVTDIVQGEIRSEARPSVIIATLKDGFTSVRGEVSDDSLVLTSTQADVLGVEIGSECFVTPLS